MTIRCSSRSSRLALKLRTHEGSAGTLTVTVVGASSENGADTALPSSQEVLAIERTYRLKVFSLHQSMPASELAAAAGQHRRYYSSITYSGAFTRNLVYMWLDELFADVPKSAGANNTNGATSSATSAAQTQVVAQKSALFATIMYFTFRLVGRE